MTYREFTDACKDLATGLTANITGDRDLIPMLHLLGRDGRVDGIPIRLPADVEARRLIVEHGAVPIVRGYQPVAVAWTFSGRRGRDVGEWDHETAVVVSMDRERHETWLARLVRHDGIATLGAWRSWPANEQAGILIDPIQEAML